MPRKRLPRRPTGESRTPAARISSSSEPKGKLGKLPGPWNGTGLVAPVRPRRLFRALVLKPCRMRFRPVTPEVAGSSPVAPVENILQISVFCCRSWRRRRRSPTGLPLDPVCEISCEPDARTAANGHVRSPVWAPHGLPVLRHPALIPLAHGPGCRRVRPRWSAAQSTAASGLTWDYPARAGERAAERAPWRSTGPSSRAASDCRPPSDSPAR
jgi:hypothetical protein